MKNSTPGCGIQLVLKRKVYNSAKQTPLKTREHHCFLFFHSRQNIDIWFGIMSSDNSTWLSAEQNECVDDLTGRVKDKLPPLTPGFSQCMLLNMSGLHDTDIYYAASCDELHPFICQSQVSIGTTYRHATTTIQCKSILVQ